MNPFNKAAPRIGIRIQSSDDKIKKSANPCTGKADFTIS